MPFSDSILVLINMPAFGVLERNTESWNSQFITRSENVGPIDVFALDLHINTHGNRLITPGEEHLIL